MDKLNAMRINEFCDLLSSEEPAPGGGAAAALEGSLGMALGMMVCNLTTVGKNAEKYSEYQDLVKDALKKGEALKKEFLKAIDDDAEAFRVLSKAYAMAKCTEEEKEKRSKAIASGLKLCTETPLALMEISYKALEIIESVLGKSNIRAVSDLGAGAAALKAASETAWLNVLINVGSYKDKEVGDMYYRKGEKLFKDTIALADKIYNNVVSVL